MYLKKVFIIFKNAVESILYSLDVFTGILGFFIAVLGPLVGMVFCIISGSGLWLLLVLGLPLGIMLMIWEVSH